MSFFKKIINKYILLISVILTISTITKSIKEFCDFNKYCNDCTLCGKETNNYTNCSYYNIFCKEKLNNHIFYQESDIKKYSTFFRNISNANEFCGQANYTLNSFIDSFSLINKTRNDIKKSNINHCNYEIYNTKYYYNHEGIANIIIKLQTNNYKKNSLKLIFNILLKDSNSKLSKEIIINEEDLIKEKYEIILYNYDTIIILLDFYIEKETNKNIEEYLEIKIDIDIDNPCIISVEVPIAKKFKAIFFFLTINLITVIIIVIIIVYYRCKKHLEIARLQNEEIKRKQKEDEKINKLFETILISKEFNENDITNNCTECSICIEKFVDKCLICITPCKHIFHYECLSKFIETAKGKQKPVIKCPLCNYDFLDEKNVNKNLNSFNNINNGSINNLINKNENNMQQNNSMIKPRIIYGNCINRDITSKEDFRNNNI